MISNFYYKALVLICSMKYGNSVPIDYCLHPLNKSDCEVKPTAVFSYYKPGSRCEIETWRGCPTFNKFDNEFLCSHYCIGKLWDLTDDKSMEVVPMEDDMNNECQTSVIEKDCGLRGQFKYTFTGDLCIRIEWKGCESSNIFDTEEACRKTCDPLSVFEQQVNHLPIDDVKAIDEILDNVMDNRTHGPIQQLMFKLTTPQQTETETEAMTEVVKTTTVEAITVKPMEETTKVTTEEPTVEQTSVPTPVTTKALTTVEEKEGSAEEVITT